MIEIDKLHKSFHGLRILNGVSLSIARGEVGVLLGPSGSGKSTLLRTINGLESFDAGSIRVDQIQLGPASDPTRRRAIADIRRRVGMVFQQFNLFPHRSVLENVTEAPRFVLGRSQEEAESQGLALLNRVGLSEKASAWPMSLSGGQQQRVAIARALAMNPEVILFDEPTSALDPRMTAEVTSVIADLASGGQTMIIVTHAMSFARRVATNLHVLHSGQIVESGPPQRVFESPQHPLTRELLADNS